MITGELKNKIDSLWDVFAAGGMVNPLDVIEQITYLMFIHDLDEADTRRVRDNLMLDIPYDSIFDGEYKIGEKAIPKNHLRWSVFRDFPADKKFELMQEWIFPFIKGLHGKKDSAYSKYMDDAIFKLPTPLVLSDVVDKLNEIYDVVEKEEKTQGENPKENDVRGDVYEYLLDKLKQSGRNGQFRTPRHIIDMMVELVQPQPEDVICDPAFGTAGFLLGASKYLMDHFKKDILMDKTKREHYMNHMFTGYDMDRTMLRIGAMNMMVHGIEDPVIEYRDSLSDMNADSEKYSLILANPPFTGSLNADIIAMSQE